MPKREKWSITVFMEKYVKGSFMAILPFSVS